MKIEFLGTGGAMSIPRPLCNCIVCKEAREKGVPYSRTGPSLFIHGPNVLIDTPEDIYYQINRSTIKNINAVFYSHWHPDHVMGRRVLESLNADWVGNPPKPSQTDVYLPEQVGKDFENRLGSGEHLQFFEEQGFIKLHQLSDGDSIVLNDTTISPFRLAENYVYAFLFETSNKFILIAPDELNNWEPSKQMKGVDLAILPMGICDFHPLTGEQQIDVLHPVLNAEATFSDTIDIIKKLQAKRTILTHIEEVDGLGYEELEKLKVKLKLEGIQIEFAYDTLIVDI
ncbi:MBL fold metallo-hydrolase [Aquibacillus rhizosphaerae]|uniref:MBL fold metallo-hydrolase n=1 Tax=Aquibacillus rhizosphaerae TaxID=3051431 RepID=A0ABT7L495_9BACI|nr:MBL fold metallo-hydrolase [Aquibacillus sp. LR5S19]MDL4840692.1 MBL fold metallo-hydrolase [Aquibacillus sp. LR5S19]